MLFAKPKIALISHFNNSTYPWSCEASISQVRVLVKAGQKQMNFCSAGYGTTSLHFLQYVSLLLMLILLVSTCNRLCPVIRPTTVLHFFRDCMLPLYRILVFLHAIKPVHVTLICVAQHFRVYYTVRSGTEDNLSIVSLLFATSSDAIRCEI